MREKRENRETEGKEGNVRQERKTIKERTKIKNKIT